MPIAVIPPSNSGGGYYGYRYWTIGRFVESTDDAYLQADYTTIAPKVSGYIAAVLVNDNQRVRAGQLLARIDDRDFVTALAQAKSNVATAEADVKNLTAQIELQRSVIAQSRADIRAAEAALVFASEELKRYRTLVRSGFGTVQRSQQADADFREKSARMTHDRAAWRRRSNESPCCKPPRPRRRRNSRMPGRRNGKRS